MGELKPTPQRLELMRGIERGEVYHYPWVKPWTEWERDGGFTCRTVTAEVDKLRQHEPELAHVDSLPRAHHRRTVVLTDAGREWLAKHGGGES